MENVGETEIGNVLENCVQDRPQISSSVLLLWTKRKFEIVTQREVKKKTGKIALMIERKGES